MRIETVLVETVLVETVLVETVLVETVLGEFVARTKKRSSESCALIQVANQRHKNRTI